MAATSKHWLDVRNWIMKVIESSEEHNLKQYLTIDKLIRNYRDLYQIEMEVNRKIEFRFMVTELELLNLVKLKTPIKTNIVPENIIPEHYKIYSKIKNL